MGFLLLNLDTRFITNVVKKLRLKPPKVTIYCSFIWKGTVRTFLVRLVCSRLFPFSPESYFFLLWNNHSYRMRQSLRDSVRKLLFVSFNTAEFVFLILYFHKAMAGIQKFLKSCKNINSPILFSEKKIAETSSWTIKLPKRKAHKILVSISCTVPTRQKSKQLLKLNIVTVGYHSVN